MDFNISSCPVINSEKGREKLKTVGAPTAIAATTAFVASKAPKDAQDTIKLSKRFSKAGKAALVTAAIMAVLTTNKEEISALGAKIKEKFSGFGSKSKENAQNENLPEIAETPAPQDFTEAGNGMENTLENAGADENTEIMPEQQILAGAEQQVGNIPTAQQDLTGDDGLNKMLAGLNA